MKFCLVTFYLCFLLLFSTILSSGHIIKSDGYRSPNHVRSIADVFRGRNRVIPIGGDPMFDVHCYDTTGIRTIYDDCWNSPKTTDIVLRSRDEASRISSRQFAVYDTLGIGANGISGLTDDILVSPGGLGLNCFDTTGVRINYGDCWTSPRTRNILLTGRGEDSRTNSRRFGLTNTYYGRRSMVSVVEEVEDCYCVTQDRYVGDSTGILYVKMRPNYPFTADLRGRLMSLNWGDLDGCIPRDVVEIPYLPFDKRPLDFLL